MVKYSKLVDGPCDVAQKPSLFYKFINVYLAFRMSPKTGMNH